MKNFSRLFRHWLTTKRRVRHIFSPTVTQAIQAAIAEGEKLHRAEVRLIVEHCLPTTAVLAGVRPRQRALDLFGRYRIWDTEENCGVLVYVNLADRTVEIVPDRAVMRLVTRDEWRAVCDTMTSGFAQGEFRESTASAIYQLNALLQRHYPAAGAHPNQLPNQPIVL